MLCTLFFLMIPQMVFSATTIEWKEQVTVTNPLLVLGDLAYLSGDDPARLAVLQSISMGETPPPGQTRYLTGDVLLARLSAAGIRPWTEGWPMPGKILVTTLSQVVAKDIIDQKVSAMLTGKLAYPKEDITIKARGSRDDVQIPLGSYEIITKLPQGIRFSNPTQVIAEIWVDNRLVKSIYLVYDVQVLVNAYVIKNTVAAHQFLTDADIAIEKKPLVRLPVRAVKDEAMFKSYWTRRTLSPGTVLAEDMLDIPPAVKRNSQVTILVDTNGIVITTYGFALQDGRPGDVIRVQNLETKRIIMTKVQQNGMVVPLGV